MHLLESVWSEPSYFLLWNWVQALVFGWFPFYHTVSSLTLHVQVQSEQIAACREQIDVPLWHSKNLATLEICVTKPNPSTIELATAAD